MNAIILECMEMLCVFALSGILLSLFLVNREWVHVRIRTEERCSYGLCSRGMRWGWNLWKLHLIVLLAPSSSTTTFLPISM